MRIYTFFLGARFLGAGFLASASFLVVVLDFSTVPSSAVFCSHSSISVADGFVTRWLITLERGLVAFFGFSSSSPTSASGFCSSSDPSDLVHAGERDNTHLHIPSFLWFLFSDFVFTVQVVFNFLFWSSLLWFLFSLFFIVFCSIFVLLNDFFLGSCLLLGLFFSFGLFCRIRNILICNMALLVCLDNFRLIYIVEFIKTIQFGGVTKLGPNLFDDLGSDTTPMFPLTYKSCAEGIRNAKKMWRLEHSQILVTMNFNQSAKTQ